MCTSIIARARRVNYMFEMLTGLYMLDAWEKGVFNATIFAVLGVGLYFLVGPSLEAVKGITQ